MFILPDFFWVRISLRNILFGFSTNYFRGLGLRIRVMERWFGEKISERQDWGGMDIYGGKMMGIREKDFEDGVASKEETGKAKKEVCGCGERGHGWGWSDGGGYRR